MDIVKAIPDFFVRNDDLEIFSLNTDKITYSNQKSKDNFPESIHNKYSSEDLDSTSFFPFYGTGEELYVLVNRCLNQRDNKRDDKIDEDRITILERRVDVLEKKNTTWAVDSTQQHKDKTND